MTDLVGTNKNDILSYKHKHDGSLNIFALRGDDKIYATPRHGPGGGPGTITAKVLIDGGKGTDTVIADLRFGRGPWSITVRDIEEFYFYGRNTADKINLNGTKDDLRGYGGDDTFNAGSKDDYLDGGPGDDTLIGGSGDDILVGGLGADEIDMKNDRSGKDIFRYYDVSDSLRNSMDIIALDRGTDKVDLSPIDSHRGKNGNQAFKFIGSDTFREAYYDQGINGAVRYDARNNIIEADLGADGDLEADLVIKSSVPFRELSASNFIL